MAEQKNTSKKARQKKDGIIICLLILLLLLLLFGWLADHYHWWPWNDKSGKSTTEESTGTNSSGDTKSGTSTKTPSGSNTDKNTSGNNNSGSNGGTTTPTTPAPSTTSILNFYTSVNSGDTKEEVSSGVKDLSQSCTVTSNSAITGKQEVCLYSQGSKLVTVTYLNDRVVSVSRSGF